MAFECFNDRQYVSDRDDPIRTARIHVGAWAAGLVAETFDRTKHVIHVDQAITSVGRSDVRVNAFYAIVQTGACGRIAQVDRAGIFIIAPVGVFGMLADVFQACVVRAGIVVVAIRVP